MNCQGQTKLNLSKRYTFRISYESTLDIMLWEETKIDSETFTLCEFLTSNYTIINNNADTEYGTAVIIKNNIQF